ncbi:low-specificity L-threonine aldolase [Treponema sp. OMZ 840]
MPCIDVRSDTVTWPTSAMRKAVSEARVGDDVYGEDPTVKELEQYGASLAGKEAALFVPSGTFANQLALFTHCPRGSEVVLDDGCHIVRYEAGASAVIAGVQLRTVEKNKKTLIADPKDFEAKVRTAQDLHEPQTALICLENATSSGRVLPLSFMQSIKYISNRHHVPVHMDGARIFNAAAALHTEAAQISAYTDSLMFCLSKGLCAPCGSLLAGSSEFIERARYNRKIMGGAMRQSGMLAAAGLIALKEMRLRLAEDHENARFLAEELAKLEEIEIDPGKTEINMVFFKFAGNKINPDAFTEFMAEKHILTGHPASDGTIRMLTHYWIKRKHIEKIVGAVKEFLA